MPNQSVLVPSVEPENELLLIRASLASTGSISRSYRKVTKTPCFSPKVPFSAQETDYKSTDITLTAYKERFSGSFSGRVGIYKFYALSPSIRITCAFSEWEPFSSTVFTRSQIHPRFLNRGIL